MSAAVVQVKPFKGTGLAPSATLDLPTTAGNALIVLIGTSGSTNASVTAMTLGGAAGNFAEEAAEGNGSDHAIASAWSDPDCAGGETAVAITLSGSGDNSYVGWIFEVSGMPAAGPLLDKSAVLSSAGFVASWTLGPTGTTTQTDEIWFGLAAGNVASGTAGTYTGPGAPWTDEASQGIDSGGSFSFGGIAGYQVVSATGTASYDGSVTPNSTIEGLVVALKAASGTSHTATASLTVTPSLSAARTRGQFRTAALTVTPSLSAARTRGTYRTASLLVTPTLTPARTHGHGRTASLTVTPSLAAARTVAYVRGGSLTVTPTFTVATSGGSPPAAAQAAGGWWQLHSILKYAEQEFDFYASRPPMACPRDGEPLRNAPPADSGSDCELYCMFCGWEYPRDWQRPFRPG